MSKETNEVYITMMFLKHNEWGFWFYDLTREQWKIFYEWLKPTIEKWEKEEWS